MPAVDVRSGERLPGWARATVDGYAVRAADTYAAAETLPAFLELAGLVQAAPVRTLPFTNDVITSANPDYRAMRALVRSALEPAPPTSAPPASTVPPTTDPGTTVPPSMPVDPTEAVDADEVCG